MSTPLRVLVVDDEPLARQLVRVLLAGDPEVELVGECSGEEAAALAARTRPDILFLDVQMPGVDGFGVLAALDPAQRPVVVFVTAYDAYALRAFEVHALDYLLKPVDDARFVAALARAKEQVRARRRGELDERLEALLRARETERAAPARQRLLVRTRDRTLVVDVDDVDWIEAADYQAVLHVGDRTHLVRETLTQLEVRLDPARFCRVHRKAIVNVSRVREIHPLFRGDAVLVLADRTRVPLSRTRRAAFEALFQAPSPPS